ncbi:MAG: topoisomerase DNA-binding C4 zinc finger domain-containing protein, partial [Clostridia bacterium]|nr:topoisomerase DNA-binding C4 zinc finger domain-containing protein [Clostridia bacterium]
TKFITPTELGFEVNDFLQKYFNKILEVDFTAKFETKLDKIADNEDVWQDVIREFYDELMPHVESAQGDIKTNKIEPVKTNIKCDICGKYMNLIDGKYGKFLSCSGYPDCKSIKSYDVVVGKCPKCGGDVLEKRSKTQKIFYGCKNYPNCDYVSWDKPMNIKCPKCEGMILERKSRAGKLFYSCENVQTCKFVLYNKPVKEVCPKCNGLMVEKITDTSTVKVCTKCNNKVEDIKK